MYVRNDIMESIVNMRKLCVTKFIAYITEHVTMVIMVQNAHVERDIQAYSANEKWMNVFRNLVQMVCLIIIFITLHNLSHFSASELTITHRLASMRRLSVQNLHCQRVLQAGFWDSDLEGAKYSMSLTNVFL